MKCVSSSYHSTTRMVAVIEYEARSSYSNSLEKLVKLLSIVFRLRSYFVMYVVLYSYACSVNDIHLCSLNGSGNH